MGGNVFSPVMQFGFAGFCAVLLGILVWVIRRMLTLVSENIAVMEKVAQLAAEQMRLLRVMNDRLLSRPCLKKDD